MFPKIASRLISHGPDSLHYNAHRSNSKEHIIFWVKKRGGMYKSGICDTKPAISLKRSSL